MGLALMGRVSLGLEGGPLGLVSCPSAVGRSVHLGSVAASGPSTALHGRPSPSTPTWGLHGPPEQQAAGGRAAWGHGTPPRSEQVPGEQRARWEPELELRLRLPPEPPRSPRGRVCPAAPLFGCIPHERSRRQRGRAGMAFKAACGRMLVPPGLSHPQCQGFVEQLCPLPARWARVLE